MKHSFVTVTDTGMEPIQRCARCGIDPPTAKYRECEPMEQDRPNPACPTPWLCSRVIGRCPLDPVCFN